MTLGTLANLGEFISGVAVVLSLVYLAFQVRQNTLSLRTETYARALDRVATLQARLSADPGLAAVFGRGVLDTGALTSEQRIRFTWAFYEMFGAFEFMYHQSQAGALQAEVWERRPATLSSDKAAADRPPHGRHGRRAVASGRRPSRSGG